MDSEQYEEAVRDYEKIFKMDKTRGNYEKNSFFSPPVQVALWAHMHRSLSVRLSVVWTGQSATWTVSNMRRLSAIMRCSRWTKPEVRMKNNFIVLNNFFLAGSMQSILANFFSKFCYLTVQCKPNSLYAEPTSVERSVGKLGCA